MAEPTPHRSPATIGRLGGLLRARAGRRRRWSLLVPVIAALAGLLFTTSAHTAAGTALRDDRRPELTRLISEQEARVAAATATDNQLRAQVDAATQAQAQSAGDASIREQQQRATANAEGAGLTALRGPGLTVSLDDAPRRPDGSLPAGAQPDDVVVHQQDVQSVVNALWAGGAEAMSIEGVRVISTSAVRCVGNTLLLHGQVYSPPFDIAAIGNQAAMRAALGDSPGVQAFTYAANRFGLGYSVNDVADLVTPAFTGTTRLEYAKVVG